jgi:hypothetical protein
MIWSVSSPMMMGNYAASGAIGDDDFQVAELAGHEPKNHEWTRISTNKRRKFRALR